MLFLIAKNTAKYSGGGYPKKRLSEIINDFNNRSNISKQDIEADNIISSIIAKGGIKLTKK